MSKVSMKKSAKLSKPTILPELVHLEEAVGQFIQYWGFKRIHGRIWLHLYTSSEPLDSAELMRRLGVSKGLMSLAVRELLDYQVILQAKTGKHGTVFYEANSDLQAVITNVLRSREALMLDQTRLFAKTLRALDSKELKKSGVDLGRVESVLELTESAQGILDVFISLQSPDTSALFDCLAFDKR